MIKNHQLSWQGDDLQALVPDAVWAEYVFLCVTADNIVAGSVLIHHIEENFLDARALFIDDIIQRINQVINPLS